MSMISFELFFFLLLVLSVRCSENHLEIEKIKHVPMIVEKPHLVRQRNSPRSQNVLQEFASKDRELDELNYQTITLNEAWRLYEEGRGDLLMRMMEAEGFNPNSLINGLSTPLLISAIQRNQISLVRSLLAHPNIDVNYSGNTELLPLEVALNHPTIFNLLLNEAHDLNILKNNLFGVNDVHRAIELEDFVQADRLLKEVRLGWDRLSEEGKGEFIKLQEEYNRALREHRSKMRENKIKRE